MTLEEKVAYLLEQKKDKHQATASKKFYLMASFLVLFGGLFATYRLVGIPEGAGIFASTAGTPENIQITQIGTRTFTLTWKTGSPATGYIKYGKAVENKELTGFDDKATTGDKRTYTSDVHQVTVNNAEANQLYFYTIVSKGKEFSASEGSIFTPIKTLAEDGAGSESDTVTVPVKSGFADF